MGKVKVRVFGKVFVKPILQIKELVCVEKY